MNADIRRFDGACRIPTDGWCMPKSYGSLTHADIDGGNADL
ncbi:hypothetical protein ACQR3P_09085 [Rhodococcus sp. IEGM1300]